MAPNCRCAPLLVCSVVTILVLGSGCIWIWYKSRPDPPPPPPMPTVPPLPPLPPVVLTPGAAGNLSNNSGCTQIQEEFNPYTKAEQINSNSLVTVIQSKDPSIGHQSVQTAVYHLLSAKVVVGIVGVLLLLLIAHSCHLNTLHSRLISHTRNMSAGLWGNWDQDQDPPAGSPPSSWAAPFWSIWDRLRGISNPPPRLLLPTSPAPWNSATSARKCRPKLPQQPPTTPPTPCPRLALPQAPALVPPSQESPCHSEIP